MQQAHCPLLSYSYLKKTRTITQEEHVVIVRLFLLQSALTFFCRHIPVMTQVSFPASGLPRTPTNSPTKVASFAVADISTALSDALSNRNPIPTTNRAVSSHKKPILTNNHKFV
jgi:hypothetical protein